MAFKLRDISNLTSSLPTSQIPLQRPAAAPTKHPPLEQQLNHPSLKLLGKHHPRISSLSSDDSGCDLMDDSLTDMQWLQRMDAGSDFPGLMHGPSRKRLPSKGSKTGSGSGKEGCRKKLDYSSKKGTNKPPLSYASLIALAICSTPQRMMTLSSIYRWIEYTFPFYRTPEAKAWKNSIRHNLSIRKNMFMKVYQYPPRRGNGSYWTLLSDGEEELKKAVPLFATLQPPVIDSNSAYHHEPSTHTVKSKGKFIPVLPRSDSTSSGSSLPYFSVGASNLSAGLRASDDLITSNEIIVDGCQDTPELCINQDRRDRKKSSSKRPKHLHDHSYAKIWPLEEEEFMDGNLEMEVLELGHTGGMGNWDGNISSDNSFCEPSTPKRRRKTQKFQPYYPLTSTVSHTTTAPKIESTSNDNDDGSSPSFTTPPKEQDNSLHLLDSSFLTPLKNLVPDVEIGAISFSPLYTNLVTPKRQGGGNSKRPSHVASSLSSTENQSQPFLPSPFTPLKTSLDSGIFSPLQSDSLSTGLKFSTPTNLSSLSPLGDLNSSFACLQPEIYSFKTLDNSGSTPFRPGSLQGLGLPGLTPPGRK